MTTSRRRIFQKLADILTVLCLVTTGIMVFFLIFGPKEGLEAMIIIIPWILAVAVHLTLGIGALVCAWLSRAPWRNSWIYIYFLLFFGLNAYYLVIFSQMDIAAARKIDDLYAPGESELYALLQTRATRTIDTADAVRARELVRAGADLHYQRPGTHQPLVVLAAGAGDPELVRRMLARGADVNGPVDGATVDPNRLELCDLLQQAAPSPEMVCLIAASGVDLNRRDPLNRYPLKVVKQNGPPESVAVMIEAGADPALAGQGIKKARPRALERPASSPILQVTSSESRP